jgi:hypothetical protein
VKQKELAGIKTGDLVWHKHLGKCRIEDITWADNIPGCLFGVIVVPLEEEGKKLLSSYCVGIPDNTPRGKATPREVQRVD